MHLSVWAHTLAPWQGWLCASLSLMAGVKGDPFPTCRACQVHTLPLLTQIPEGEEAAQQTGTDNSGGQWVKQMFWKPLSSSLPCQVVMHESLSSVASAF